MMEEPLARQAHYSREGIQPIDYILGSFPPDGVRGYFAGNIIKYLYRYRDKNGTEDLKKARVYLNWLIEWEEKVGGGETPVPGMRHSKLRKKRHSG